MTVATMGITIPNFVVAPILDAALRSNAGWLPVGGWNNGAWENKILPIVTLGLPQVAVVARLTRGAMIEALRSHHIRTARANGLPVGWSLWFTPCEAPCCSGFLCWSGSGCPAHGVCGDRNRLRYSRVAAISCKARSTATILCHGHRDCDCGLHHGLQPDRRPALCLARSTRALRLKGTMNNKTSKPRPDRQPKSWLKRQVGRSLWDDAWARLKANRAAMTSFVVLFVIAIACFIGLSSPVTSMTLSTGTM